jgi:hypothetical protein
MLELSAALGARAAEALRARFGTSATIPAELPVARATKPEFGELQLSSALQLGKLLGQQPRDLAQVIAEALGGSPEVARVEIAYGHHEKLDGTGYPRGVAETVIPVQTRIMTVSDIFDALTASDRPYKKALPPQRALEILDMEGRAGQLDADVVQLLLESQVYRKVLEQDWRGL